VGAYKRKIKKGERWRFVGSYLGKSYASKSIYLTKREALDAEREYIRQMDEEARRPRKEIMLIDFLNIRLDHVKANKSRYYYNEHKRYLKMLLDKVGNKPVDDIKKLDVAEVVNSYSQDLRKRKKTQHKANAMLRILKATFFYGINLHDLDIKNPCVGLKMNSVDKKLKHIPSDPDIEAVMAICNVNQKLLIQFVRDTGCRISEALRLGRGDVFDDYVVLYTRKAKNADLTPRRVPKPDYLNGFKWKGRLFVEWTSHPRFLEEKVKELKQQKWNWHNLRHRYASRLSKEGRPLFEIMSLLGHSNLSTTQGYLQLLP
jgi:integrase